MLCGPMKPSRPARIPTLLLTCLCLAACGESEAAPKETAPTAPAAQLDPARYDHFGAGVAAGPVAIQAAEVVAQPTCYSGDGVRVAGTIQEVCQRKGCWINVGPGPTPLFVKFKDYGFFLPKDAAGREVVLVGEVQVKTQSVEEARHYLEDAGKHDEAQKITAPVQKVTFLASGVAVAK